MHVYERGYITLMTYYGEVGRRGIVNRGSYINNYCIGVDKKQGINGQFHTLIKGKGGQVRTQKK